MASRTIIKDDHIANFAVHRSVISHSPKHFTRSRARTRNALNSDHTVENGSEFCAIEFGCNTNQLQSFSTRKFNQNTEWVVVTFVDEFMFLHVCNRTQFICVVHLCKEISIWAQRKTAYKIARFRFTFVQLTCD